MKQRVYGYADFETIHQLDWEAQGITIQREGNTLKAYQGDECLGIASTGVKCAGLVTSDGKESITHSVPEFLLDLVHHNVSVCYFHNLAFDCTFIQSWIYDNQIEGHYESPDGKERYIADLNECDVYVESNLLGPNNTLYQTVLAFNFGTRPGKKNPKVVKVTVKDSAKIWTSELRKIGQSFNFPKGDEALRVGCDSILEEYCLQDCRIVKKAMEYYFEEIERATRGWKANPLTNTGDCRPWLTAGATTYNMALWWLENEGAEDQGACLSHREATEILCTDKRAEAFPVWFRDAYRGASPLLNPAVVDKTISGIHVFDVNSMYPSRMVSKPLPIGKPVQMTADEFYSVIDKAHWESQLWIAQVYIDATVKPGHRPTWLLKARNEQGETLASKLDFTQPTALCSVDMQLLERDYDIRQIDFIEGFRFKRRTGLFRSYIQHWYEVKEEASRIHDGARKAFAKLMLNSLYGKFGENPDREDYEFWFNEDGCIRVRDNGPSEPKYKVDNPFEKRKYLPMAVFITAYARDMISRCCNAIGWEHVAYTDTDSIHCNGLTVEEAEHRLESIGEHIDKYELGAWDLEEEDVYQALYHGCKQYAHQSQPGSKLDIKMCGVNSFGSGLTHVEDLISPSTADSDHRMWKHRSYRVKGGILMFDAEIDITRVDNMVHKARNKQICARSMKALRSSMLDKAMSAAGVV